MKKVLAAAFAFAALVTAHGAVAADLSLAPLYKAPPAEVTQAYNWTGFYFGANGGGGWGIPLGATTQPESVSPAVKSAAPSATTGSSAI